MVCRCSLPISHPQRLLRTNPKAYEKVLLLEGDRAIRWPGQPDYAYNYQFNNDSYLNDVVVPCTGPGWTVPYPEVYEESSGIQKLLLAEYLRDASSMDARLDDVCPPTPPDIDAVVLHMLIVLIDWVEPGLVEMIKVHVQWRDQVLVVQQWRKQQTRLYQTSDPASPAARPVLRDYLVWMDKQSKSMFEQAKGLSKSEAERYAALSQPDRSYNLYVH